MFRTLLKTIVIVVAFLLPSSVAKALDCNGGKPYLTFVSLDPGTPEDVTFGFQIQKGLWVHASNCNFANASPPTNLFAFYDEHHHKWQAKLSDDTKQFELSNDGFVTTQKLNSLTYLDWDKKRQTLTPYDMQGK